MNCHSCVECSGGKLNSIQGRIKVLCGDERHRNPLSPSNKFARIVPKAGLSHNPHGGRIESDVWLNENNAPRWSLNAVGSAHAILWPNAYPDSRRSGRRFKAFRWTRRAGPNAAANPFVQVIFRSSPWGSTTFATQLYYATKTWIQSFSSNPNHTISLLPRESGAYGSRNSFFVQTLMLLKQWKAD